MIVKNLRLRGRGSSWLAITWSLPCSERSGAVLGYNLTWCGQGKCEEKMVDGTSHNITNLTPWLSYNISLTVITMGLTGGTTDPITLQTLATTPASPPRNLRVVETTNTTANVSWDKPRLSNGPISSYRVSRKSYYSCHDVISCHDVTVSRTVIGCHNVTFSAGVILNIK